MIGLGYPNFEVGRFVKTSPNEGYLTGQERFYPTGLASVMLAKGAFSASTIILAGTSIVGSIDDLTGASSNVHKKYLNNIDFIKNNIDAVGVATGLKEVI